MVLVLLLDFSPLVWFLVVFCYLILRVSAYVVGQSPSLIAQSVRPDAKLGQSDPGNCLWRRVLMSRFV